MIEKLDIKDYENKEQLMEVGVINKINILVDAVNAMQNLWLEVAIVKKTILELQTRAENVQPNTESRQENVQDPFAEQRKWIGKLCRFWDKDYEDCIYDTLHHIDPNCVYKYCRRELGGGYSHCEPIKPDDDIIYKGE